MKKVFATILAVAMILSLGVISFAAEPQWTGDTDGTVDPDDGTNAKSIQDNGTANTLFKVLDKSDTVPTYWMSVSVPLGVTFCIAADGTTSVPNNYKVENYSPLDAKISKMNVVLKNDWKLVDSAESAKNSQSPYDLYFTINNRALSAGSDIAVDWTAAKYDGTQKAAGVLELPLTARAGERNVPTTTTEAAEAFAVTYTVALAE